MGNPFTIAEVAGHFGLEPDTAQARAVAFYGQWVAGSLPQELLPRPPPALEAIKADLAGKNLACWCRPGTPCHADILLVLANGPES